MLVIKGAGDIASGVALRLYRAGYEFLMTDIERPTAIRRTVSFCEALVCGETAVEGIRARRINASDEAAAALAAGVIPVIADPDGASIRALKPEAVVDAVLAKRNLGTAKTDAPVVIALGPGFFAGVDCHAVVETKRGHTLGRVILAGPAIPNTGEPGSIGGYTSQRVLRAPAAGGFRVVNAIGDMVLAGDVVAYGGGLPVRTEINGVLRGILADGTPVFKGMKCGDVDPRGERANCFTASDKALAVGGGVLEALLHYGVIPEVRYGN